MSAGFSPRDLKVISFVAGLTDIKNTDQSSRHVCL